MVDVDVALLEDHEDVFGLASGLKTARSCPDQRRSSAVMCGLPRAGVLALVKFLGYSAW